MHMCNKSSRGDQILAKWSGNLSELFELSLETKDDEQVSAIFEISTECALPALWRSLHPEALRKCLNSPKSLYPGTKLLSYPNKRTNLQAAHRWEIRRQEKGFQIRS